MLAPSIASQEPIAFDPSTRHQNEHSERRIAESESLWQRLGEHAHEEINLLQVAGIDTADLVCELFVSACELEEGGGSFHVEESTELAVPWDTTLSVTQDIYSCDVSCQSIGCGDLAKEVWVVVVGYGTRIVDSKGVEGIPERCLLVDCVLGFLERKVSDWCRFGVGSR